EAFSRMLNYIQHTQKRSLSHLQNPEVIPLQEHLSLDMYSKRNLELTETFMKKHKYGSLLWVLDHTVTAMGARLLKKWLERPLLQQNAIDERLNIVQAFYDGFMEREQIRESLTTVYDLERHAGRISYGNVNARYLIQLKQSLQSVPELQAVLGEITEPTVQTFFQELSYPEDMVGLLETSIVDEPPISITEGNIIKKGYHEKLGKECKPRRLRSQHNIGGSIYRPE